MRLEFDAGAKLPLGSSAAADLIAKALFRLQEEAHPDRYICAYMPGGTDAVDQHFWKERDGSACSSSRINNNNREKKKKRPLGKVDDDSSYYYY
jgi:hypothetical protein